MHNTAINTTTLRHKGRLAAMVALCSCALLPIWAASKHPAAISDEDKRKAEYIFLEAENQKAQGNMDAFYDLTSYAHSVDTTNATIAYYLGYCLLNMASDDDVTDSITAEQRQRPLALMKPFVEANPNSFYEVTYYSDVCMALGKAQDGLEAVQRLAELNPNTLEVQTRLASGYMQVGEPRKAIAVYDAIDSLQGRSTGTATRKVTCYATLGDTASALREMHLLLNTAPRSATYNLMMGAVMQQLGYNDSILYYYNKAQEYEPDNGYTYLAKANFYNMVGDSAQFDQQIYHALINKNLQLEAKVSVLASYAQQLMQKGDSSSRATQMFTHLLEQYPHEGMVRDLYGQYLATRKDYKGAAEQFSYEIDIDPTNTEAWHRLVISYMLAEDFKDAIDAGQRALQHNPDSINMYSYLAPAYYQMKEYDKALEVYEQALKLLGDTNTDLQSELVGGMGDVYFSMGDTVKAFQTYDRSLEINPNNTSIMNNYAYFLALTGKDLDKAESLSAKAVQAYPDNATFLDTYAWVFFKKKNYPLALMYIRSAIEKDDTHSSELLEHYGDILYMSGDHDEALKQWEKALEQDPKSETLQKKVKEKTYFEK